ncbi:MAG TPA: hypothetical protein VIG69_04460 [Candidatus Methylomirabilis sp.]
MLKRGRILGALALAVSLTACRGPEVGGGVGAQFDDYPDVPVPASMARDREHSLRLETPAVGSVVNVYRGGTLTADALAEHFVKQMPDLGWRLVSRFQGESAILVYEKAGRLCLLGIGLDRGGTTLSVLVGAPGGPETPAPAQGTPRN